MTAKERYGAGRIVVFDHDAAWAAEFEKERARVQEALGPIVVTVEHVGSTAVPGLAAKPIIDLLVGVRSLPEARTCCVEPMRALRYRYMAEYEAWLPGEMLFRKGPARPLDPPRPPDGADLPPLGGVHPGPRLPAPPHRRGGRVR
jgi:GrpB-like predicted nucleotidyltransferase (UPF0157 family)